MSRRKRLYLPGCVFHITARAHCKLGYFKRPELRDEILAIIASAVPRSDAHVLAHAVLPNHYHIVVKQGFAPLAQLLQPINRQIALLMQRVQKRKGYVFERRFFAKPCLDADQMRELIVYTHRNAVRAKLCRQHLDWRWSGHADYVSASTIPGLVRPVVHVPLPLFADDPSGTDGLDGYLRYVAWRDTCDELPNDAIKPPKPRARFGDSYYRQHFVAGPAGELTPDADLRDVVLRTLKDIAPDLALDYLRSAFRSRPLVAIRGQVIQSALRARHRNRDIA
ncbi:MAG TPA: hypothetical protein VK864_11835, partial [Longimicrobiales bacterium]|nr:hypothetical protein [Longimicrobiales bacterium]